MVGKGLFQKHFNKTFFQNICSNTEINANFHFSHYKSMETLSCHSNESTWAMTIKNTIYVCKVSASFPLRLLRRRFLKNFFENLPYMLPWQRIKFSDLDKIHMNHRGLLRKHFCKKENLNTCSETAKIANFHFSHFKSMETISFHSNQSSYRIGTKNTIIRSPGL